jgi:pimeloyl-ACP methyl ester carboxylesterase
MNAIRFLVARALKRKAETLKLQIGDGRWKLGGKKLKGNLSRVWCLSWLKIRVYRCPSVVKSIAYRTMKHISIFALALSLAMLACLVCAGCVSPAAVARHALEAPNHQSNDDKVFKQLAFVTTNFPVQKVSVGPPPASMELMVIEPGDYGATMTSNITARRPRYKGDTHTNVFAFAFGFTNYPIKPKLETNDIRGTVFLLHGYGLNKDLMLPWGMVLARAGYRTVLVDLRGHGHSTGERIYFGRVERTDLAQCLDALEQRGVCRGPVGVLGISYGAVLALQWAAVDPRVQSVTAISPYSDPGTAMEEYLKVYAPVLSWRTDHDAAGIIARQLANEWPDSTTASAVRGLKQPVLFVRGGHDELCSRDDLSRLRAAAPEGSEMREVPMANHLVTGMCITQLEGPVTNWFGAHLAH